MRATIALMWPAMNLILTPALDYCWCPITYVLGPPLTFTYERIRQPTHIALDTHPNLSAIHISEICIS